MTITQKSEPSLRLVGVIVIATVLCLAKFPYGVVADETSNVSATRIPAIDVSDFESIFDGKTLGHWDGDPTYWSVSDGKLTGTVTPETLLKKNSWIVYRGTQVEDFELVLDYRVSARGNSGVGYRLAVLENDPVSVRGPQADIHGLNAYTGICYEENGRRLLAGRGQSTWIRHGKLPHLVTQFGDPEELQSVVNKEDWNRYHLIINGQHAQHFLNGVLVSEVRDHDDANRMKQGLIGVQVHVGPPMTIEYRNIYLKHLGSKPKADASRGNVVYQPGTLREPEHAPTFNHLAQLAARATAPVVGQPINGKEQLVIRTADVSVVRSDLKNVKLSGGTRPLSKETPRFDLVLLGEKQTIRIPGAGADFVGATLSEPHEFRLQWDALSSRYQLVNK